MTTYRHRSAALTLLFAAALTGCGAGQETDPAATEFSGAAMSTQPEQAIPAADGAETAAASSSLISARDLPAGWRDSDPPNSSYRMSVGGVDLEPVAPVQTAQVRFAQSALGPFLYEYVRVYAEPGAARSVADALAVAVPTCTEFSTGGDAEQSPQGTFTLEQLTAQQMGLAELPDGAVAWRMTPHNKTPITQDLIFVPRGDRAVVFLSAAFDGPDPTTLGAAIEALEQTG